MMQGWDSGACTQAIFWTVFCGWPGCAPWSMMRVFPADCRGKIEVHAKRTGDGEEKGTEAAALRQLPEIFPAKTEKSP
jgi:hypothetical protein